MNRPSLNCPAIYPIKPLENSIRPYRRILVFDTETTGLLKYVKTGGCEELDQPLSKQPHLTQLSYMVYDIKDSRVSHIGNRYCVLPEGVEISKEAKEITGITEDILREKGISVSDVLAEFAICWFDCHVLVAHNWNFDKTLLEIEFKRNMSEVVKKTGLSEKLLEKMFHPDYFCKNEVYSYCTMLESVLLCDIRKTNKNGELSKRAKYPKLVELYQILFDDLPDGQMHNSLYDVCACLRCFLKIRLGIEMPRNRYYHLLRDCVNS